MLLDNTTLDGILCGDIDLVFRRWKKPTVRTGGTLRTRAGMLDIHSVEQVAMSSITVDDAHRAGYRTKAELIRQLRRREGRCFRITVAPGGPDPLVELRSKVDLDEDELIEIAQRLNLLDRSSSNGPWTHRYLDLIATHPHIRAEDLAKSMGSTKPDFKVNVRKLKRLGLTISHSPGYELSPRGARILAFLDDESAPERP